MLAVDVQQGLSDAWERVVSFVPKLAGFLVLVVVGYVIANVLRRVVDRLLARIGFDGWVERGVLGQRLDRAGVDPSRVLAIVTFWAVMLFFLQLALGVFGPNPVSDLLEGLIAYLPNIFAAVVILVVAALLAKVVTDLLRAMLSAASAGTGIARIAGLAILILGVFAALNQLQIAPAIVNAVYYAILAAVVGASIVAIGVGGIRPMRDHWERASLAVEAATGQIKAERAAREARAKAEGGSVSISEEDVSISIDAESDWKPPRARGYELGAPSG